MKKSKQVRCLISNITKAGAGRDYYFVDVLQADTANLATKTGIGSTVVMSKTHVAEALKLHGLKTVKSLVGAPVICSVKHDTGNVLGSSTFYKNTY